MTAYIPTSSDELSEEFFAAWFHAWCNQPDEIDPADALATFCAF
jgi:hypothetical protein